ncbi:hypothetical protein QTP88_007565 [Uroleucon formosanum]
MAEFVQVEVTDDADAVTSELFVENTVGNPVWYTIEDNHVSMVFENIEKVIKLETDIFDDYIWRSRIDIIKDVDNQSIMELPLESQDVADNNIYLNHGNTSDKIFLCHICGKSFVSNYLFKNHMTKHKREVHHITHECKFCGKQFKLRFGLNRHIQKNHNPTYKCRICRLSIDCSKYIEHEEYHEKKDSIVSIVRATPYFCIRKLPNIKNEFSSDDYEQTSQNKLVFTCKICKSSPSTDIHSFALHMSDHGECNKNECIVCDKTFTSVVLWTAHMINHQQQIDLNVSTVQSNLLETESNTFDPMNSRNTEPQVILNSLSIEDNNTESATMSKKIKKEIESSTIKKTNFCDFCNRKFLKRCYYTNHMRLKHNINTNIPKKITSTDCNKSIIRSEEIELNEYKNKLSVPINNKNGHLNNHVNKSDDKKSIFCIFCNKHFAHLGALTNHTRIHENKTYKCQYCFMQFTKKGLYIMHEKTHVLKNLVKSAPSQNKNNIVVKIVRNSIDGNSSGTNNSNKCEVCGKIYSSISNLRRHISTIHAQTSEPIYCNICSGTFKYKNKYSYMQHLRSKHKQYFKDLNTMKKETTLKEPGGQII